MLHIDRFHGIDGFKFAFDILLPNGLSQNYRHQIIVFMDLTEKIRESCTLAYFQTKILLLLLLLILLSLL